ncbi:hypothetical protein [Flavobacterium reichenbachii]|uniref:Uncharacterized protein n=1 Tax=Flavobacterium reichenbachii TaxID=362418 RepID=A0A085ZQG1_9FLAO|nr:hypothetical protein [Flavobacterium reichenbachii]KFF06675.1 hypothetical protein IW19_14670 [Flavobacterium reichenbachii]OXB18722.1 hypothetical protein B0A68_01530 [Flavobacterium reichenbachii]
MKLKFTILSVLFFIATSFAQKLTDEKYLNYLASIENEGSTFQFFLVINIKNLNTGESREICTDANGLLGALHREYGLDYEDYNVAKIISIAKNNKTRHFEFRNPDALKNLGIEFYSPEDLLKVEKSIDFNILANQILKTKNWKKNLDNNEITMYAHALFNRGILTGENNCSGGTLFYVNRNNPVN